jgi:hypothetical protein
MTDSRRFRALLFFVAAATNLGILPAAGLVIRNRTTQQNASVQTPVDDAATLSRLHACLAGKRIVFIGPSVSKYDYLALAYFAEYGRWPVADQVAVTHGAGPNPLYEWNIRNHNKAGGYLPPEVNTPQHVPGCNAGGGTETFMRYTNHILNGHEVCDGHQHGDWKGVGDLYNSTENRIYLNGDTMISYFQWFGDTVPPRGTFDISPLLKSPPQAVHPQCPVGQFPGKWAWTLDMQHFLINVVKYAAPTHLVISAAFWPTPPSTDSFWTTLAQAGKIAVSQSNGQVLWRTTPERTDHPKTNPAGSVDMAQFTHNGWQVFPAADIVAQLAGARQDTDVFYDFTHLRPLFTSYIMQKFLETNVCSAPR